MQSHYDHLVVDFIANRAACSGSWTRVNACLRRCLTALVESSIGDSTNGPTLQTSFESSTSIVHWPTCPHRHRELLLATTGGSSPDMSWPQEARVGWRPSEGRKRDTLLLRGFSVEHLSRGLLRALLSASLWRKPNVPHGSSARPRVRCATPQTRPHKCAQLDACFHLLRASRVV